MSLVIDVVDLWEADSLAYKKAGGKQPEEDDMCAQLMKIPPTKLSFEALSKVDDMGKQSSDAAIDWVRAKPTFLNDHGAKEIFMFFLGSESGISLPGYSVPFLLSEQLNDDHDDNYEPTQEELLNMDDEQLLAFVRNGGRFGGGRKPPPRAGAGGQQQRQQQRRAGQGSHAAEPGCAATRPHRYPVHELRRHGP